MKYKFIACGVYFLILYLIAFFSNKDSRSNDDFLLIQKTQWQAIAVMWLPCIIIIADELT